MIIINLINSPSFNSIKGKYNQLDQSEFDGQRRREGRGFCIIVDNQRECQVFVVLVVATLSSLGTLSRRRLTAHDGHRSLGQAGPATCLCFIEMRYGQHRVTLAAPLTDNAWPRRIHEIARSRRISDATAPLQLSVGRSVGPSLWLKLGTFVALREPLTRIISPFDTRKSIKYQVLFWRYVLEQLMSFNELDSKNKRSRVL